LPLADVGTQADERLFPSIHPSMMRGDTRPRGVAAP
jgi:hypothetical protein